MEERNKKVKIKVIRKVVIYDLVVLGIYLLMLQPGNNIINILCIILILIVMIICNFIGAKLLTYIFSEEEYRKDSEEIVNNNLSTEKYIQVMPIKADDFEDFILKLVDVAEFYAIISEDKNKVIISLKFNNEEKMRFLQKIDKEYFNFYYMIKYNK